MKFGPNRTEPQPTILVGGPPRSGTTLMNALLTTSEKTNPIVPECHYFTSLVEAYHKSFYSFHTHTAAYFQNIQEYEKYHGDVMMHVLHDVADYLGNPEFLILKDPYITPFFELLARLLPTLKFIYMLRDPRDVVASTLEVYRRRNEEVTPAKIVDNCNVYNRYYKLVVEKKDLFGNSLAIIKYEDLVTDPVSELQKVRALGLSDIAPETVWADSRKFNEEEKTQIPFFTPLWGEAISASSVGKYKTELTQEQISLVNTTCASILQEHYSNSL
jgi:hypothetical protein